MVDFLAQNSCFFTASFMNTWMIILIVPPTIQPLQNKTITEDGNLNLYCNASGTPPPVVSWARIRSGQQFNGSLLKLTNVSRNQAGDYRCEASNECGTKSSTARIYVKCKCLFKHGVTTAYGSLVNTYLISGKQLWTVCLSIPSCIPGPSLYQVECWSKPQHVEQFWRCVVVDFCLVKNSFLLPLDYQKD